MGFAASLFDDSEDEVEFWRAWNSMPREERRQFRRRLGIQTGKLLKAETAASSTRKELAKFVKAMIQRPARGGARRRGK